MNIYNKFKRIVDDYGFGDKIWVTEISFPTGGWYPTKVRENKLPETVIKTSVLLAAAGCRRMFWYQLFDPVNRSKTNSEDYFGLVRSERDYTSKGAEAFRLCAGYLSDSTCYTLEPAGLPRSLRIFWFQKSDGGTLVLWKEGIGSRQVRLLLPGTDHIMRDPVSGNASPIQAEEIINVGSMPVFITYNNLNNTQRPIISKR
jgi:hypothetical protein